MLFAGACASPAETARHAVVVAVRAGDQRQSDKNKTYCRQTANLFESAGFDRVSLFFEGGSAAMEGSKEATDTAILARLKEEAEALGPSDEFWFVLYGYASSSSRGVSLATKGKRLSGTRLTAALDAIKARQCVLALNQGSAALMKPLCTRSDRRVLTATSSAGQLNPPLLPEHLFTVWAEDPSADCRDVFRKAAQQNEAAYKSRHLVVAEVPQLFDGKDIHVYPFDDAKDPATGWSLAADRGIAVADRPIVAATAESSPPAAEPSSLGAIDFSEFDRLRTAEEQKDMQPATAETVQLIAKAKQSATAYTGFSAFFAKLEHRLVVNLDESTSWERKSKIYLLDDVASETYGHIVLEDFPPEKTIEIQTARIVYPDGRFLELESNTVDNRQKRLRYHILKVPGARAGCLIELTVAQDEPPQSALPNIDHVLAVQKSVPVASARIAVEFPAERKVRCKLYGATATPTETTGEYSRKRVFELEAVPALEPLPFDPPRNDAIRLAVSSLGSWAEFKDWTDRIMQDSDVLDETTRERAAALTHLAKTDAEKVKALYEFLCELRYETTPIGARAFRPRLPEEVCSTLYGDCKDKANALVAMARSVGVTGYMALVNRSSTTDETFPGWQFNHAVAWFPELEGFPDGLWCDATDGSTPFASLPPGDIGRSALVLKESEAVFKTIQLSNPDANSMAQDWILTVAPSGAVKGTVLFEANGLSDYYLRQALKRASPRQARYVVQGMVNQRTTGLSVERVETTALADLATPLHINATCSGSNWALTRASLNAPYELWDAVAGLRRDRELELNDGQPFTVSQTIRIKGDPVSPSAMRWGKETDIATMEVAYASTDDGWERRSVLELVKPRVPPEAYPLFRTQVSEWNAVLRHHLTDKEQSTK